MNGKYSFLYLIDKVVLLQFAEVHTIYSRWPGNGGSLGYHCIQQCKPPNKVATKIFYWKARLFPRRLVI